MKKRLLGLLLMPILIGGMSMVNASDTRCWNTYGGTPPTTTYASGIVYGCDGEIPIITIYGDDGKGITIKAMNEGTGTVAIGSLNDTGAYGSLYQRGNNYPFPNVADDTIIITSTTGVDASGYGPRTTNGYYYSGIWIGAYNDGWGSSFVVANWDISYNANKRGGSGDYKENRGFDTGNFSVINSTGRQAMCPEGYHIPSAGEWDNLLGLWSKNYGSGQQRGNKFSEDLQIPFAGQRHYGTIQSYSFAGYWSSSPYSDRASYIRAYFFDKDSMFWADYSDGYGYAVRCFKNSYVKLPKTLNLFFMSDDEEVGTGEVTENMTGAVSEKAKNLSRTGYELFWIRSGATTTGIFDFDTTPISGAWADENNKVYFIAQWTGIKYSVEFTGTDVEGTMENQTFTYDVTGTLTPNAFTRDGYTFGGWTDGTTGYTDGQEVINLTTTSGDVITLTAEWTKIETKPSGGSSGGGGRSSSKDVISNDSEKSSEQPVGSQVDSQPAGQVSEQAPQNDNSNTQDSSANASEGQTYTQEFQQAYEFAHEKGITTMPTIQKADMDGKLTRIAMAKMLSQYAMNVLGQKPANIVTPKFNDVTDKQNSDYDDGVSLAYQLGIMGQNMPNNKFRPDDEVTRAEFATALSRMLYHTSDGEYKSTDKYYTNHMKKLVQEKIITNDDAKMKELRGYVMIMLMRSAK